MNEARAKADAPAAHDGHSVADAEHDAAHDEHGHDAMGLGPVDLRMWATGLVGVALGLAAVVCLAVSTGYLRPS